MPGLSSASLQSNKNMTTVLVKRLPCLPWLRLCYSIVSSLALLWAHASVWASENQLIAPVQRDDGWLVAHPVEAGFDKAALALLLQDLKDGTIPNTHAVLIQSGEQLIFEEYFDGDDEKMGSILSLIPVKQAMSGERLHDIRSVTKSVTSILLGIALGSDFENAVSAPLSTFFPQFELNSEIERVNLHHVLTMTAGFEWNEWYASGLRNDEVRMNFSKNPTQFLLEKPLIEAPGEQWNYNGGLTEVVARIIESKSTQQLESYAVDNLFSPLEITEFEWYSPRRWGPMPSAAAGLRLKARDLAKIGALVLNKGKWNDTQVVPQEWIELSTMPHTSTLSSLGREGDSYYYGYQWWVRNFADEYTAITAVGNGGQRVFILPDHQLAVTIFAGHYGRRDYSEQILHRIMAAKD